MVAAASRNARSPAGSSETLYQVPVGQMGLPRSDIPVWTSPQQEHVGFFFLPCTKLDPSRGAHERSALPVTFSARHFSNIFRGGGCQTTCFRKPPQLSLRRL